MTPGHPTGIRRRNDFAPGSSFDLTGEHGVTPEQIKSNSNDTCLRSTKFQADAGLTSLTLKHYISVSFDSSGRMTLRHPTGIRRRNDFALGSPFDLTGEHGVTPEQIQSNSNDTCLR